ncbi:hypothetical protein N9937_02305 [bacterium]|nr:hypothetical protein [bacterium]
MFVICIDAGGFEDQLTYESVYMVEFHGENGYQVYNDNEELTWYGSSKFAVIESNPKE